MTKSITKEFRLGSKRAISHVLSKWQKNNCLKSQLLNSHSILIKFQCDIILTNNKDYSQNYYFLTNYLFKCIKKGKMWIGVAYNSIATSKVAIALKCMETRKVSCLTR